MHAADPAVAAADEGHDAAAGGHRERGRRRRAVLIGLGFLVPLVVIAVIAALLSSPGPTTSEGPGTAKGPAVTDPVRPPALPVSGPDLYGAWVQPPRGGGQAEQQARLEQFESDTGRPADLIADYYKFDQPIAGWRLQWARDHGRIPLISWHGGDSLEVASGSLDAELRQRIHELSAAGDEVLVRYQWEMDTVENAKDVHDGPSFIAAWNHIRALAREEGADNLSWVWCPTAAGFTDGTAESFYPGADQVDWVCADGYNFAPTKPGAPWRSFQQIFAPFAKFAKASGKPAMIGEFGALERNPGDKATWYKNAAKALKGPLKGITAVVVFDSDKAEPDGYTYKWRVDSSESSLAAFKGPFLASIRVRTQ